ncbi:MAG TPA: hypothetical protein VJT09_06695, partial [Pyrinomonadaceae bacterium]|nr:hypothetical protein [Pyrinomonadaceae bacterium]
MRHRRWVIVLFCLFSVSLLLSQISSANAVLKVNEATTRLRLGDKQTSISLAVENPTGHSFPAHVHLELLNPKGQVVAAIDSDETIKRGNSAIVMPLPLELARLSNADRDEMLWFRLRYQISPLSQESAAGVEQVE